MNVAAFVVGLLCLAGISFAIPFLPHERSGWPLLALAALGVLLIVLGIAGAPTIVIVPWLAAALGSLALLALGPRNRGTLFKLGVEGPAAAPTREREGLPEANILRPVLELRQALESPPPGHWSVSLPNPMNLGKGHTVRLVLPSLDRDLRNWLRDLGLEVGKDLVLTITPIDADGAFNITPPSRTVPLESQRKLPTEFFAEPIKPGSHPLRIEIHAGPELLGWHQHMIKVRRNAQKVLAPVVTIAGIAGTLVTVLQFVQGLG